jgi:hypothetical protein
LPPGVQQEAQDHLKYRVVTSIAGTICVLVVYVSISIGHSHCEIEYLEPQPPLPAWQAAAVYSSWPGR